MTNNELWFDQDIKKPIVPRSLVGRLYKGDKKANKIGVRLYDDNAPITFESGTTCVGKYFRADGYSQAVSGTKSGNKLSFDLPAAAYEVEGRISIFISANLSGDKVTWLCLTGTVDRTDNDAWIDPDHVVPDTVEDLIAEITAMREATAEAVEVTQKSVRYDTEQTITAAQMAQARANILASHVLPADSNGSDSGFFIRY